MCAASAFPCCTAYHALPPAPWLPRLQAAQTQSLLADKAALQQQAAKLESLVCALQERLDFLLLEEDSQVRLPRSCFQLLLLFIHPHWWPHVPRRHVAMHVCQAGKRVQHVQAGRAWVAVAGSLSMHTCHC